MKAILINTIALLMVSFSCCKADESPSLKAEIINAKAIAGGKSAISLDFVLTNLTDKPINLAERSNSWGGYQWSFTLTDKTGSKFELSNPIRVWYANLLTTFSIPAGGSHTMRCILHGSSGKTINDPFPEFLPPQDHYEKATDSGILVPIKVTWNYPVKVIGHFSAPILNHSAGASTNWTGQASTTTVNIEETEQDAALKAP